MAKRMLKSRSRYSKRRLTMIFVMCTIIAVSLMTGFSGLNSDNTKHSAVGQRICMYADIPTDGSSPSDHDLISNVKFTTQRLYMSRYFRGETSGNVTAELGMGMSYDQKVRNTRVVKGDKIFTQSVSTSWAKKVAEQKYIDGTRVLYRASTEVTDSSAKFADSVTDITAKFGELYGLIPNELTKQVLSVTEDPQKDYGVTIRSVRDDNAKKKSAANAQAAREGESSDAVEVIDFEVPQELVPDSDGNYKFTLTLDPVSSTMYSRNETRTLAGSSQNPDYSSESNGSVVVTIKIDKNWYPISVQVRETYGIEIKGIGALICNSSLTETFYEIGNENIVLPEQEFFESHMNDIGGDSGDIPPKELGAADYLQYSFGSYISGAKNLDLSADISVGDVNIKNLKLSVNIGTMNVRARYGDLFVEYGDGKVVGREGEKLVYITLNDIKGYLPVDKVTGLLSDPDVKSLISMFAPDIKIPDLGSLFGDDLMTKMTFDKDDEFVTIHIPLELDGLATVNADMKIKAQDPYDLVSISGAVEAFGKTITINVKPVKAPTFEQPDESYIDLSPVVDIVPAAISTVLNNEAYGISGDIAINGNTLSLDAYILRDGFKSIAADADITLFGQRLNVKYVGNTLYASIGNVGVKAATADIPALVNELTEYVRFDAGMLDKIKALLPETIDDWLRVAKRISVDENRVEIGLRLLGAPITIAIERDGNAISGLALDLAFDMFDVKLDASLDFDITTPDRRAITPNDIEYIDAKELPGLIPYILDYVKAEALSVEVGGKITASGVDVVLDNVKIGADMKNGGVYAQGDVTALDQTLSVSYADGVVYAKVGNIKFKFDTADVDKFSPAVNKLLAALGIDIPASLPSLSEFGAQNIDIASVIPVVLDAVKSVSVKDGVLVLVADISGESVTLEADVKTGRVSLDGSISSATLDLDCTVKACTSDQANISVSDPDSYSDVEQFVPTIDKLADVIAARALSAKFDASYGTLTVGGTLALDLADGLDGLKLSLTVDKLVADGLPHVTAKITLIGKTAYIELDGDIKAALEVSADDVKTALDALRSLIPQELRESILKALDMANDLDGTFNDMLQNAKAPTIDEIRALLDKILSAISLSASDGNIQANVALLPLVGKDVTVAANAATDLSSAHVTAAIDGKTIDARLYDITASAGISAPDGDFVTLNDILPIVESALPLFDARGFKLGINVTVFGVRMSGEVTLALPDETNALAASAQITVGDVPLYIAYKDDTVYIDVDNGNIMLSCPTDKAQISALLEKLTAALPELGNMISGMSSSAITDIIASPEKLLSARISLEKTADGFTASANLSPVGLDAEATIGVTNADGKLAGLSIYIAAFTATDDKDDIRLDFDFVTELGDDGAIKALRTADGAEYATRIEILDTAAQNVAVSGAGYISLGALSDYISPAIALANGATAAKSLSIGINASVTTDKNKRLTITGKAEIDFEPLAVRITLGMLGEKIYVTYIGKTAYIKLGAMELRFALGDDIETSDIARLHAVLAEYLPAYLAEELEVMFGLKQGTSSLGDIGLIMDRLKHLGDAGTTEDKVALLFDKLHGYDGAPSAIKSLMNMLQLYMRKGTPVIGFAATDGITIDISPYLTADKTEFAEITLDTVVFGMTVHASISAPALNKNPIGITAPENSANYVSIIDYVELINNIAHTFSTKNADGDVTFQIDKLEFGYKEANETVKNDDGTTTTVEGRTITASAATDENGATLPVLKGKFVKNAKGKYDINLEAHIKLSGLSKDTGDISLGLYVLTNYNYTHKDADGNPVKDEKGEIVTTLYDKVAFLTYHEAKTGYGENISIDYGSVMQILASALKILAVKPASIEEIIPAEYRVGIDSDIFRSMGIVGMDKVRDTIDSLVELVVNAKAAFKDISAAWDLVKAPDSMKSPDDNTQDATREQKIDALLGSMEQIKALLNSAVARFTAPENDEKTGADENASAQETQTEPTEPQTTEITVAKFSDIVNGISLTSENGRLGATVSNSLTTNGNGTAKLLVSQGKNASGAGILNGFTVSDLDVKSAVINKVDVMFTAGGEVAIAPDMSKLINVTDADNKMTYSDFSNIKHMLFDVLNTANLKEFDIGGKDTSDAINVHMKLGADWLANLDLNIKFNVKVKIIKVGEDENGKAIYKTAAAIELYNEKAQAEILGIGSKVIVPECTTRLFFYDDVLYVQGVSSFGSESNVAVGNITSVYECTRMTGIFKFETYFAPERDRGDLTTDTSRLNYVNVMYTVDELFYMMQHDINRFLDEFLYYLVPITTEKFAGQDIRGLISSNIGGSSSGEKDTSNKTIAKIFKGYTYSSSDDTHSTHALKIGLAELASSSALSDLDISLTGANDKNDNLLDNYISSLSVSTKIANIITVNLDATLRNVKERGDGTIESVGLAPTGITLMQNNFDFDGNHFYTNPLFYDDSTIYTIDGTIDKDGDNLFTSRGVSYAKTEYVQKTREWITAFASHPDYGGAKDSACYDNFTRTLTKAYSPITAPSYRVDANGNVYNGTTNAAVAVKSLIDSVLADVTRNDKDKIVSVENRAGGIAWDRIWKGVDAKKQAA